MEGVFFVESRPDHMFRKYTRFPNLLFAISQLPGHISPVLADYDSVLGFFQPLTLRYLNTLEFYIFCYFLFLLIRKTMSSQLI